MPTIASFLGSYFLCHTSLVFAVFVRAMKQISNSKCLFLKTYMRNCRSNDPSASIFVFIFSGYYCPVTFEKTIALVMTSSGILGE